MRKKIIISILLVIIIFQSIIPIKVSATGDGTPATGFGDTVAGLIIEPTVEFFIFFVDALMSLCSDLIMPGDNGIEDVMVNDISDISETRDATTTYTITNIAPYKNGFGILDIQYPNFTFSTEDIFAGRVALLNIDFISGNDSDGNPVDDYSWERIRQIVAQWYKVLRMVTIIGLLSILIYTGIKIMLASTSGDKAKYKEMLINWLMAVVLAFSLHYIMAFIMSVIGTIMSLLDGVAGVIEVDIGGKIFKTNLIGLARFQMQQQHFSAKISYLIIYIALVVYTFKFTFVYLKRVLYMAFLTIISPIVALTYPIDKMDGKAKGFEMWLKEYMYNALLQPMHYVLYYVLVTTSLALAASNPLYAIVALSFMTQAEKLLKKIFGIDKAKEGTVNGLARAFGTGAMVGALNNLVGGRSGKGKKSKGGKGGKAGKGKKKGDALDDDYYITHPRPTFPTDWSEFDNGFLDSGEEVIESEEPSEEALDGEEVVDEEAIDAEGTEQLELDGEQSEIDEIFEGLNDQERAALERYMAEGFGINADGEYFNPYTSEFDGDYIPYEDEMYLEQGEEPEGEMIPDTGSPVEAMPIANPVNENPQLDEQPNNTPIREMAEERDAELEEKKKTGGFWGGMAAVGKSMARPIWDFDKSGKYNGKRLARGIAKGVLGTAAGITAAAVQAGISITDGKYNLGEGAATFAAGYAGMAGMIDKVGGAERKAIDASAEGDKEKQMERAQARYGDREDVIAFNKQQFPENPKEAMQRQRDNYLPRGITDLEQMKQCMNYANVLIEEKGLSQEDADRRAAATFEFRQKLQERGQLEAVYNQEKRNKYVDMMVEKDVEDGTQEGTARRRYLNAFRAVQEFDAANV